MAGFAAEEMRKLLSPEDFADLVTLDNAMQWLLLQKDIPDEIAKVLSGGLVIQVGILATLPIKPQMPLVQFMQVVTNAASVA